MEPFRIARYLYLKIIRLKGDPYSLARGVTLGVALGIIPIVPVQTMIIIIMAPICRGNTIAGILAGLLVGNPLTLLPLYYLSWKLGKFIYPADISWHRVKEVIELVLTPDTAFGERFSAIGQLGYESIIILLLGGAVLAIPAALICYPLTLRLFLAIQRKRRRKHILS